MDSSNLSCNEVKSEDEGECCCPICFQTSTETHAMRSSNIDNDNSIKKDGNQQNLEYVYSRTCGHIFCLPCVQQILLASSYMNRTSAMHELQEDEHVVTTTQGACPMCRKELSYFDLLKVSIHQDEEEKRLTTKIIKSEDPAVSFDPLPMELLDTKFLSSDQSYIEFPKDITTQSITLYKPEFKNDAPNGVLELTKCTYLAHTKTFKAHTEIIDTTSNVEFTVWLNFSDNFQFITHGVCRKTLYEEVVNQELPSKLCTKVKNQFVYPFSVTDNSLMCRVTPPKIPNGIKVPYSSDTFWGNIFCQHFVVGLASYHFVMPPDANGNDTVAYISYDHKMTSAWPPLDNGRPIPSRVLFRNIRCPDPYTFYGSICWYEDYQTSWNGCSRWDYEIKFDTAFFCIRSGTVHSISMDHFSDNPTETEIISKMSTFGEELNYMNAGLCKDIIEGAISTYDTTPKDERVAALVSYRCTKVSMLNQAMERLQSEGVAESTYSRLLQVMNFSVQSLVRQLIRCCEDELSNRKFSSYPIDLDYYPIDLDYYFE